MKLKCEKCHSNRILEISTPCTNQTILTYKGKNCYELNDFVPYDIAIHNNSNNIELDICLDCGQTLGIQNHPNPEFYTEK